MNKIKIISLLTIFFNLTLVFSHAPDEDCLQNRKMCLPNEMRPFSGQQPLVQMDSRGDALAIWLKEGAIYSSSLCGTGSTYFNEKQEWTSAQLVAKSEKNLKNLSLAHNIKNGVADFHANYMLVWLEADVKGGTFVMTSSLPLSVGMWQTPQSIFHTGNKINSLSVAVNSDNKAMIVWEEEVGVLTVIKSTCRLTTGQWIFPQQLSSTDRFAAHPSVVMDEEGRSLVTWIRQDGENNTLESVILPADGSWVNPVDLALL